MFPIFHVALRHLSVVAIPQISRRSRTSQRVERKGRFPVALAVTSALASALASTVEALEQRCLLAVTYTTFLGRQH